MPSVLQPPLQIRDGSFSRTGIADFGQSNDRALRVDTDKKREHSEHRNTSPLLAEEGWRDSPKADAPGWSVRRNVSAALLLRLRPIGLALRATPSAPRIRSAHPPLLCEEGNGFPIRSHLC